MVIYFLLNYLTISHRNQLNRGKESWMQPKNPTPALPGMNSPEKWLDLRIAFT